MAIQNEIQFWNSVAPQGPGRTINKGDVQPNPVVVLIVDGDYSFLDKEGNEGPTCPGTGGGYMPVVCYGIGNNSSMATAIAFDIKA